MFKKAQIARILLMLGIGGSFAASAATLAHWTFGEKGMEDISGHGHVLESHDVVCGTNGWATFNGTSSYLKTVETMDLTSCRKLTVECWMKPEALTTDFGVVFVSDPPGATSGGFVLYYQRDAKCLQSQFRSIPSNWDITSVTSTSLPYSEGGWHHVALVMDPSQSWSSKAQLFVDGVKIAGTSSQQTFNGTGFLNQHLYFGGGASYGEGNNFFKGGIDDIRISDEALTPDQFLKFPTAGRKMTPDDPTFAFWKFGAYGVKDTTGNGYDFTNRGEVTFPDTYMHCNGRGLGTTMAFPANCFSNSGLTYEFFVRTSSANEQIAMLLENSAAAWQGTGRQNIRLQTGWQKIYAGLKTVSSYNEKTSFPEVVESPVNDGRWHHIASVYDPKGAGSARYRIYYDGKQIEDMDSQATDIPTLEGGASLFFGVRNWSELGFTGDLDDLRVTARALKPSEFLRAPSGDPDAAPLVMYDFTAAEPLKDQTGNGNDLENYNNLVTFDADGANFTNLGGNGCFLRTKEVMDLSSSPKLTLECNFQISDFQSFGLLLATENADVANLGSFVIYKYLGGLYSQFGSAVGTWYQDLKTNFSDPAWHHLAYVVNGDFTGSDRTALFLDGVKLPKNSVPGNAAALQGLLAQKLCIGGGANYGSSQSNGFAGRIRNLCVTQAVLAKEEFKLAGGNEEHAVIAYWPFRYRSTGEDKSGNGHHLVGHNVPVVKGAAKLTAGASWFESATTLDLSEYAQMTVEFFAKGLCLPSGAGSVLSLAGGEGTGAFTLGLDGGQSLLQSTYVPDTLYANTSEAPLSTFEDGEWHHVAMVFDRGAACADNARLYVDGVLIPALRRGGAPSAFANGTFKVGTDVLGANETGYELLIDELKITSGALKPSEFMSIEDLNADSEGTLIIMR